MDPPGLLFFKTVWVIQDHFQFDTNWELAFLISFLKNPGDIFHRGSIESLDCFVYY